jgi:hypothetical protein
VSNHSGDEDHAVIRIDRALMEASIVCPSPLCGYHCRCVGYVAGELALFECRACQTRYYLGLGASPVLRAEPIAVEGVA